MNKFFTVALLLVTGVALNAGPGCSSCPAVGTKTTSRTSSCPSGKCGSSTVVVEEATPESKTVPTTPAVEEEAVVVEDAE